MTEKEKMLSGKPYDASDPELMEERAVARARLQEINQGPERSREVWAKMFANLLGAAGQNLVIQRPFYCDYGYNIEVGHNVYMNFNCCILDVMEVKIGNNVMLGPGVQIYTATHPLEAAARASGLEFAKAITIANDVWIGGGAIINPGVHIGNGVVVGAGSVVTRDIPNHVFVGGNPARVIKVIDQHN